MGKEECWSCGGGGVVQRSWNRGYSGVCQACDGDGYIFKIGDRQVSKTEHEEDEADDAWDDDD